MKRLSANEKWRQLRLRERREKRRLRQRASQSSRLAERSQLWGRGFDDAPEEEEERDPAVLTYSWPDVPDRGWYIREETATIKCPKTFSLIENPDETIEAFDRMVVARRDPRVREIIIDQRGVVDTDLCASAVLGVLVQGGKGQVDRYQHLLPTDPAARELARAAGLPRILRVPFADSRGVLFYDLVAGPPNAQRAKGSSLKEIEATNIVDYIDRCFGKYDFKLLPETRRHLSILITEVLSNSEDHTDLGAWWMAAYLRQGAAFGDCHLTLFNLGRTISESLRAPNVSERVRGGCEPVRQALLSRKAFKRGYTEECFWNLAALQPGVTSKPEGATVDEDRGTGFVRIIEAFQEIGVSPRAPSAPVMAVISGSSYIRLDGTYRLQDYRNEDGNSVQRIAFNADNDLKEPPDRRFVHTIRKHFPGTILSCRFYIDRQHLLEQSRHVTALT